jgi:primosomal protein N' (replication factor Y)
MYAQVVINSPVDTPFDYHLPPELEGRVVPGHLVQVSFGTSMQPAIVVSTSESSSIARTKPILALLDPHPVVAPEHLALARWMAERTLAPLGACLWLWLPPGLTGHSEMTFALLPGHDARAIVTPEEQRLVELLTARGVLRARQIDQALKGINWRAAADALAAGGVIEKVAVLTEPRVKPRRVTTAALTIHPDGIEAALAALARGRMTTDRLAIMGRVLRLLARERQPIDVSAVYAQTDATREHLKKLEAAGLIALGERESMRDSLAGKVFAAPTPPALLPEQSAAWAIIQRAIARATAPDADPSASAGFLLHGVTGSGKTELYLRAIRAALDAGRTAVLLVPEVALVPQTARRVAARFPGITAVVHGALSDGERYDTWRRARAGEVRVIVGARSALFTPLIDPAVIILDEEHDASYKQSPPMPAPLYHARDAAEQLMRMCGGVLILGSATPSIETMQRVQSGELTLLELPRRIMGHRAHIQELSERAGVLPRYQPGDADEALMIDLPPVQVVDMRAELKAGNTGMFSPPLVAALRDVLARREQAILFMNRRGQATYVFCRDCGYVEKCPRCDAPLTFHRVDEGLRCHRCGFSTDQPSQCPNCGSMRIRYFGAGTQQIESALVSLFPKVRTARWDADTASTHDAHEAIWSRFAERRADVLIGTQMIAKGLDLPLVTLVGIVSADVGLGLPDFRAGERTFQVLTQVAGRAGRGLLGGRVILQTYQPEHPAIAAAAAHDYAGFYTAEIAARRDLGYPPFRRLVRIVFRHASETGAREEAEAAAVRLRVRLARADMTGTEMIGPAPCFFTRQDNTYRWHIMLRGPDPVAALDGLTLRRNWSIDIDPLDVL